MAPILGAELFYHVYERLVLLFGPRALDHGWIEHFLPTVEALYVCAVVEKGRNPFPILGLKSNSGVNKIAPSI